MYVVDISQDVMLETYPMLNSIARSIEKKQQIGRWSSTNKSKGVQSQMASLDAVDFPAVVLNENRSQI